MFSMLKTYTQVPEKDGQFRLLGYSAFLRRVISYYRASRNESERKLDTQPKESRDGLDNLRKKLHYRCRHGFIGASRH